TLFLTFILATAAAASSTNLSSAAVAALQFDRQSYINGLVTEDPFYSVLPPGAGDAAPGDLIKLEEQSNTSLFTLPPTASLSRIIYQSKTFNGTSVPVSAYILWPYQPRKQKDGSFPIVAWAHTASGLTRECAPSHIRNLWQHFQAPFQLSLQGYVVVATDYAGLGVPKDAYKQNISHEFFVSPSQANDIFYSVQAAQTAFEQLSKEFIVMGHSQGGGAAWAAAQRQVHEPVNGYLGAIAISPVTSIIQQVGPEAPVLALGILPGMVTVLPGFKTTDVSTPQGQQALDQIFYFAGCMAFIDAVVGAIIGVFPLVQPGWQENPFVQAWQALAINGGKEISGPLLIFHGESDPLLNFNVTSEAVENTLAKFPKSQIEFVILPNVSHIPALEASQPIWLDWIAARFAGESGSRSQISTACPARPSAAQQPELNWFINLATKFFQTP
ncbi:hypothetical protein LSUB1_G002122, partial [Lachnellula subtilissima]